MRKRIPLNEKWYFFKGDTKNGEPPKSRGKQWLAATLPHCWDVSERQNGVAGYCGICWYCKEIVVELQPDEMAFLEFGGLSLRAELFINGVLVCGHENAFSALYADITPYLKRNGTALIAVKVDNRENEHTYPRETDFAFFGGVFREVFLIKLPRSHFAFGTYGSTGVTVIPVVAQEGYADVIVQTVVSNPKENQTLVFSLKGGDNFSVPVTKAGAMFRIENPHLWQGLEDPFLYTLHVQLKDFGEILDETTLRFGIRSFYMDPQEGFFLNGKPYPLRGVCRYPDRQDRGWALSRKDYSEDMLLLRELGANCVRLVACQHDPYFYELCDHVGILLWSEISFSGGFIPGKTAKEGVISQLKQLVLQNYNHSSVICWGVASDISAPEEEQEDVELRVLLRELGELAHKLDRTRVTAVALQGEAEPNNPYMHLTDVAAVGSHFGWEQGETADCARKLDALHGANPQSCIGLSQYGADGIASCHSNVPCGQDYSEEYQTLYHEEMLRIIQERPWLWATFVQNDFDFANGKEESVQKGRSSKGLASYDRTVKKDAFYLYKAAWTKEPFVHICAKRFVDRIGEQMEVKVYSNCSSVTLFVHEEAFATQEGQIVFHFRGVPLRTGVTYLRAEAEGCEDCADFRRVESPNPAYTLEGGTAQEAKQEMPLESPEETSPGDMEDVFSDSAQEVLFERTNAAEESEMPRSEKLGAKGIPVTQQKRKKKHR